MEVGGGRGKGEEGRGRGKRKGKGGYLLRSTHVIDPFR